MLYMEKSTIELGIEYFLFVEGERKNNISDIIMRTYKCGRTLGTISDFELVRSYFNKNLDVSLSCMEHATSCIVCY